MRSEAFEAQKTHLGCRYEQREYERGPHVRGARERESKALGLRSGCTSPCSSEGVALSKPAPVCVCT
jgi:hypothetical protein